MSDLRTVYPRIDAALEVVESELEVVSVEADAFRSFLARVSRLDATTSASVGEGGSLAATTSVSGVDPAAIRAAYRDTVLAMDHYDRDYDEPLVENVEAEFGAGVRELLSHDHPIPPMQRGVVEVAARQAVEERTQFRRALVAERDSLESVASELGDVERELHEHRSAPRGRDRDERLRDLAADCQSLAERRQRSIHGRPAPRISGIDEESLVAFLYGDADHRFPALVEITDVAGRVEATLAR